MGSPFKIPKKKQPSDSCSVHMLSPLSRVQDRDTAETSWTKAPLNGRTPYKSSFIRGKMDGGNRSIPSSSPRSEVKGHAGVNGSAARDFSDQNRWRPRRASDTLCPHAGDQDKPSVKKQWGSGFPSQVEDKEEEDDGNDDDDGRKSKQTASPVKAVKGPSPAVSSQRGVSAPSFRDTSLEAKVVGFKRNGEVGSEDDAPKKVVRKAGGRGGGRGGGRAGGGVSYAGRRLRLNLSLKTYQRLKHSSAEPIVLSSDDEEEHGVHLDHSVGLGSRSAQVKKAPQKTNPNPGAGGQKSGNAPSVVELAFSTLHFGTTCSQTNGPIVITDESICIPLKVTDGEVSVEVSVVPSELLGFGVWDGALAGDGSLLSISQQPSPSLLFLCLSDAQARLLHTELSALHNTHSSGQPCPYLLVTLAAQIDELQSALLASLMDVIGLRYGRPSLGVPLPWAEGLNRLHLHPRGGQLLTLLGQGDGVGGHCTEGEKIEKVGATGTNSSRAGGGDKSHEAQTRSSSLRSYTRLQSLPRRLIQYPPPPSKGGITVTSEDLECLRDGEFLNDVIIDFYLKYLQLERADQDVANRSHIFSSFFYKQLTRNNNISEEESGGTVQYRRHQRVKTWTRHVDIFSKDFLFIPVNQEAHWYLVVICFPGLLQAETVTWKCVSSTNDSGTTPKPHLQDSSKSANQGSALPTGQRQTGNTEGPKRQSHDLPDCTVLNCHRETVTRRPCILIMDSLKLSYHLQVHTLLREYLQVEWEVRRGTPRTFNANNMKGCYCKVPLQDNSSDCGLYLLQYVESFLQNPVVHFDLPLRLERWFPRQQVRRKREEIRELVLQLYRRQGGGAEPGGR